MMRPTMTANAYKIWACTPCALLLLSAVAPRDAAALFQGSGHRDTVHKVLKVKVTEDVRSIWSDDPRINNVKALKRGGESVCPTNYAICAASLGGDCCPEHYACSKDYCYATTAATSTCGNQVGYYACALSLGGGCCPQGLICATGKDCSTPTGATFSLTCPTGYFECAASLNGGCCSNGMGCATDACYSTSPSTTTITYTTTEDGSAKVRTTISVTTPATPTGDTTSSGAGGGAVVKYFPSTVAKVQATSTSSSDGGGGGGLSKGAIGGVIAGVVVLLIVVVTAAYLIIKRLKRTEKVVQSVRETTSGTRTRRTADKKSEVSQVRVRPTPSEVDQMDYDPLMMNNSTINGSPRRAHLGISNNLSGRARGDSDAESQGRSLWSGPSAGMRWNTPSVDSDPGGDPNGNGHGVKEYFELPPRTHMQSTSGEGRPQMPMRESMESSSQYSYHNYTYGHGRQISNASELSAGSGENGGRGAGSSLIPAGEHMSTPTPPQELDIDGAFRPELPGSDTETESNHGSRPRVPRRRSTGIVSPMSTTSTTNPRLLGSVSSRRRGGSVASDETVSGEQQRRALGSIDESVSTASRHMMTGTTDSLHGHFGRPITGAVGNDLPGLDMAGAPMGLELNLGTGAADGDDDQMARQDGAHGKST